MPTLSLPLRCQRDLFSIPDGHCYLNSAFMGPLPRLVEQAGVAALTARASPIGLTPKDFFEPADRTRGLFAQLVNADPERVAFVPTVAYAMAIVAKNLRQRSGQNVVMLGDMHLARLNLGGPGVTDPFDVVLTHRGFQHPL